MAAQIVTITKTGQSGVNIRMKINDGFDVPSDILSDDVQSFRTWENAQGHFIVWTNTANMEVSLVIKNGAVAWIMSSKVAGQDERFRIDAPCTVDAQPVI